MECRKNNCSGGVRSNPGLFAITHKSASLHLYGRQITEDQEQAGGAEASEGQRRKQAKERQQGCRAGSEAEEVGGSRKPESFRAMQEKLWGQRSPRRPCCPSCKKGSDALALQSLKRREQRRQIDHGIRRGFQRAAKILCDRGYLDANPAAPQL